MKENVVTETFVRKLKEEARRRAAESGKTSAWHRDEISREAGFSDYHHVQQQLAAWRNQERQTGKSRFNKLTPMLGPVLGFLDQNYPRELREAQHRYVRLIGESLPWPSDDDHGLMARILGRGFGEFLVAEGCFHVGGALVRIGEVVLDQMKELDDVQRHYLRELLSSRLGIYMVSRVLNQEAVIVVDALAADAMPIEVTFPARAGRSYNGMVAAMRILQPTTYPFCNDLVMPFLPATFGSVVEMARSANPDASAESPDAVSVMLLRAFIEDSFGPPRVGHVVHKMDGETLVFVTQRYRVNDLPAILERLCRAPAVKRTGPLVFFYYGQRDESTPPFGEVHLDPQSHYAELKSLSDSDAAQAKGWFEHEVGDAVSFLHTERQTPNEMLAATSEEEMQRAFADQSEQIPTEVQSQVFQQVMHEQYRNWADTPLPAFDGLTPRAMCERRGGEDRVRAMLEFYETNEVAMAARMRRPPISYAFLWQQVGIQR